MGQSKASTSDSAKQVLQIVAVVAFGSLVIALMANGINYDLSVVDKRKQAAKRKAARDKKRKNQQ